MQVKEYKSPEEALKEVKDPIIRSAIEPLSDKVAELKKNAESLEEKENKNPAPELETKSKQIHLLIKPSIYRAINELAEKKETSFNNLVNIVLEMYAKRELKKLEHEGKQD